MTIPNHWPFRSAEEKRAKLAVARAEGAVDRFEEDTSRACDPNDPNRNHGHATEKQREAVEALSNAKAAVSALKTKPAQDSATERVVAQLEAALRQAILEYRQVGQPLPDPTPYAAGSEAEKYARRYLPELYRKPTEGQRGMFGTETTSKQLGLRWVTIGAQASDDGDKRGGIPVQIDGEGNIVGGKRAQAVGLHGAHVSEAGEVFGERRAIQNESKSGGDASFDFGFGGSPAKDKPATKPTDKAPKKESGSKPAPAVASKRKKPAEKPKPTPEAMAMRERAVEAVRSLKAGGKLDDVQVRQLADHLNEVADREGRSVWTALKADHGIGVQDLTPKDRQRLVSALDDIQAGRTVEAIAPREASKPTPAEDESGSTEFNFGFDEPTAQQPAGAPQSAPGGSATDSTSKADGPRERERREAEAKLPGKNTKLRAELAQSVGSDPVRQAGFLEAVKSLQLQRAQEADEYNDALDTLLSHHVGDDFRDRLSLQGQLRKRSDPSKVEGFDLLLDTARRDYPWMLEGEDTEEAALAEKIKRGFLAPPTMADAWGEALEMFYGDDVPDDPDAYWSARNAEAGLDRDDDGPEYFSRSAFGRIFYSRSHATTKDACDRAAKYALKLNHDPSRSAPPVSYDAARKATRMADFYARYAMHLTPSDEQEG